mgnify:CR=1 FL=1
MRFLAWSSSSSQHPRFCYRSLLALLLTFLGANCHTQVWCCYIWWRHHVSDIQTFLTCAEIPRWERIEVCFWGKTFVPQQAGRCLWFVLPEFIHLYLMTYHRLPLNGRVVWVTKMYRIEKFGSRPSFRCNPYKEGFCGIQPSLFSYLLEANCSYFLDTSSFTVSITYLCYCNFCSLEIWDSH